MMEEERSFDVARLAERMLRDYDSRIPGTIFAEGFRPTLEQARQLQDAVARLRIARGERCIGYKIGCVSPGNQRNNGLTHPVWGRLWDWEQHADGARLARADFANVAIEGEFAVILGRDLGSDDDSPVKIMDAVEQVLPVIELHNLVFRGDDPKGAELIANNAIHSGVVRGEAYSAPTIRCTTDLSIQFDGETVAAWTGVRWPDDILQAVTWLAAELARSGERLRQGQTLLTGALGPPLPVATVGHVRVISSAFGDVEAWFEDVR